MTWLNITWLDGLVQDCNKSSALAMELLQSSTKSAMVLCTDTHYKEEVVSLSSYHYDKSPYLENDLYIETRPRTSPEKVECW